MNQPEKPLVGLITIWYRAIDRIEAYAQNLRALHYENIKVVFVIHEQTPAEIDAIQKRVPEAFLINPRANLGTSGGWNLGIQTLRAQHCDYIGIWNVDVQLDPDCISVLVAILEKTPEIGAASPILLYSDEPHKVQMYGGAINPHSLKPSHQHTGVTDLASLAPTLVSDYLDGGTILIRAGVLSSIGGFDEAFFMYYEDVDLCLRIQKIGLRTITVREARAWHFHRQEMGAYPKPYVVFYNTRNRFTFVRKYLHGMDRVAAFPKILREALRIFLFYIRRKKIDLLWAYVCGFWLGLLGNSGKVAWFN